MGWLKEFLTPGIGNPRLSSYIKGLYTKSDITPYIHILVYHIHELMNLHKQFGLKVFSCSPIERKNGMQTAKYFQKTTKDGGKNNKLAVIDILDYENCALYYYVNEIDDNQFKIKKIKLYD